MFKIAFLILVAISLPVIAQDCQSRLDSLEKISSICKGSDCPVQCDHEKRARACCRLHGVDSQCSSMCSYETSSLDFVCRASQCSYMYNMWRYCTTHGRDTADLCATKGVPAHCTQFCEDRDFDWNAILSSKDFLTCLPHTRLILQLRRVAASFQPATATGSSRAVPKLESSSATRCYNSELSCRAACNFLKTSNPSK